MMMTIFIQYFWLHHIIYPLILEAQTGHAISSCKAVIRKKLIEGFVLLFVHSKITIIHDILWKTALLKKFKIKSSFQGEKRNHSTLCSTILHNRTLRALQLDERTLHNPWLLRSTKENAY